MYFCVIHLDKPNMLLVALGCLVSARLHHVINIHGNILNIFDDVIFVLTKVTLLINER